jgi:hypothetical protein
MLRIGQRQYELVRAQSGFHVQLFPRDFLKRTQEWRLDAHYIPTDRNTPRDDDEWEYLRLTIFSEKYHLDNWRNLTGLGLDNDDDTWFGSADLENLLEDRFVRKSLTIVPGRLDVTMAGDYLFHCTFDGILRRGDAEEDLEFEDDIPFAEVSLRVPINAADPVATARALAARAVGLTEISASRVTPYDWRLKEKRQGPLEDCHRVYLRTPWRHHMA